MTSVLAPLALAAWLVPGIASADPLSVLRGAAADGTSGPAVRSPRLPGTGVFLENQGQWPAEVLFYASSGLVGATVLADGIVFQSLVREGRQVLPPPFTLRFPDGRSAARVSGIALSPTKHHLLIGPQRATDLPGYAQVLVEDIVPGVDLRVRCEGASFAYDVEIEAGAKLPGVLLELEGVQSARLLDDMRLETLVAGEPVVHEIGDCWQNGLGGEGREPIACRFRLLDADGTVRIGFEVPDRDAGRALVIDPSLLFGTYWGASGAEQLVGLAVSEEGDSYLLARNSLGSPTTPGTFQPDKAGGSDVYLVKITPNGAEAEWATYLGGEGTDRGVDVSVDDDGTVVVVGRTWSPDFPTSPDALQPTAAGLSDAFATRLAPSGDSLVWSTFIGGSDQDYASACAVYPDGSILLALSTESAELGATSLAFDETKGPEDKLIMRINAGGTGVVFSTFLAAFSIWDVGVDGESNSYISGSATDTTEFPTTSGAFQEVQSSGASLTGFVAKLDPTGSSLHWASYLGGSHSATIWGIAVDSASAVYVCGQVSSQSGDFPVTAGAFDTDPATLSDGGGGFVTKFLPDGSGIAWSTFIAGCCGGGGYVWAIEVDSAGNVHSTGSTNELGWPTTTDAFQPNPSFSGPTSSSDAFLTKFDAFGEALVYSSWYGGSGSDYQMHVGLDGSGNPYIGGQTFSPNLPVTQGAAQTTYAGGSDFFLAAFELPLLPWRVLGGGLQGDSAMNLAGGGPLTPGSTTRLSVRGGVPNGPAWIVAGVAEWKLPILGGVLMPSPDVVFSQPLDTGGAFDRTFPWPSNPPDLWFQVWGLDPGAPFGWGASNALRAVSGG